MHIFTIYKDNSFNITVIVKFSTNLHIVYTEKMLTNGSQFSAFYEEMFNFVGCLTCNALWLFLLFEHKGIYKFCVTNAQLGYNIVTFSFWIF